MGPISDTQHTHPDIFVLESPPPGIYCLMSQLGSEDIVASQNLLLPPFIQTHVFNLYVIVSKKLFVYIPFTLL